MSRLFQQSIRLVFLAILVRFGLCESYVITPGTWNFRGHPIAYESAETRSLSLASVVENSTENRFDSSAGAPLFAFVEGSETEIDRAAIKSSAAVADPPVENQQHRTAPTLPVLLLNGFGVGSFHQHRLIHELLNSDQNTGNPPAKHRIYCVDYLGQGKSWPVDCQDGQGPFEVGLRYCGQTWVDQIVAFIEQVVIPNENKLSSSSLPCKKIHIVGNSVGGHLAVFVAAQRPDLVESLALLNATPVWGLNLPFWSGKLPAPWLPKIVGRYLFDRIRDLQTIEKYLEAAYFNKAAFDATLIQQIRSCTEGSGGHAAFASILWSPPITVPPRREEDFGKRTGGRFYDALSHLECDVLMLFGREDPWCKPAFAKRMLERVPNHVASRYIECSEVGHCPNHEAPVATAQVLHNWLRLAQEDRKNALLFSNPHIVEKWGVTTLLERRSDEIQLKFVDRLVVTFL